MSPAQAGLRRLYASFNEALSSLYHEDLLTLSDEDEPFDFDEALFEEAAREIYENGGFDTPQLASPAAQAVVEETMRVLDTAISSALPHEVPETLRHALENNAFIFSGFKTFHALREVGLSMVTDKGDIKPFQEFLHDVHKINAKYNRNYLYAEYNHALGASQMAARWHDIEQDGDNYDLQYRTAGDNRVREEHAALHGTTLPPSDPFWERYLPPNGWNCRCTAVQVRRNKYPRSDSQEAIRLGDECTAGPKKSIFRYNPGKTMEVFPPKHPYLPKGCGNCDRKLSLAYDPGNDFCRACVILRECVDQRNRDAFRSYKKSVIDKATAIYNKPYSSLLSGLYYQTKKSLKRGIGHAVTLEEVEVFDTFSKHLDSLVFVRVSPLGEGKDLNDPKDVANIQKKKSRGVSGYNVYELTIGGTTWIVKTEVFKNRSETLYYIRKKR